jgi:hypothetical protein
MSKRTSFSRLTSTTNETNWRKIIGQVAKRLKLIRIATQTPNSPQRPLPRRSDTKSHLRPIWSRKSRRHRLLFRSAKSLKLSLNRRNPHSFPTNSPRKRKSNPNIKIQDFNLMIIILLKPLKPNLWNNSTSPKKISTKTHSKGTYYRKPKSMSFLLNENSLTVWSRPI